MNMREEITEILKNMDGISFYPNKNDIELNGFTYKNPAEYIKGVTGTIYHILLYRYDKKSNKKYNIDCFNAVLFDPSVYISWLINCEWYGFVCKKTIESQIFVDEIKNSLTEV